MAAEPVETTRRSTEQATGTAPQAAPPAAAASADPDATSAARFEFRHKARFVWKTAMLLITFIALIPILLYQDVLGAKVYLWFLIGVHAVGLVVFGWGVSREDIAPSTRGFVGRLLGLVSVAALLYLASKGLDSTFGSLAFWGTLFALWAIHTGGLVLLHLRGRHDNSCPFV